MIIEANMSAEEFLVKKKILNSTDLETKWNLNTTKDTYIAVTKQIVEAMNEFAKIKVEEAVKLHQI